jgi:hypothetical protein
MGFGPRSEDGFTKGRSISSKSRFLSLFNQKTVIVIRPTSLLLIACNPYKRTAAQAGLNSTTKRIFNHMQGGG